MVKKINLCLLVILSVFISYVPLEASATAVSSSPSPSDTSSTSAPLSANISKLQIAVLDVQGAILQTNEGKAAKVKIEKEVARRRQDLMSQQETLKKMEKEFQAQQAVLSDDDKLKKQQEFQGKFKDFQTSQMGFEQETRQKELAVTNKIYQNLVKIVQDISNKRGFDMVFDKSAGVLLYAVKATDITSDIVLQYNDKYPADAVKGAKK